VNDASTPIESLAINTIRTLSIDAIQAANSGHPGAPMGMAPVAYTLWQRFLRFDPDQPLWPNRDRFVLSAGRASICIAAGRASIWTVRGVSSKDSTSSGV
jgi:transketolase